MHSLLVGNHIGNRGARLALCYLHGRSFHTRKQDMNAQVQLTAIAPPPYKYRFSPSNGFIVISSHAFTRTDQGLKESSRDPFRKDQHSGSCFRSSDCSSERRFRAENQAGITRHEHYLAPLRFTVRNLFIDTMLSCLRYPHGKYTLRSYLRDQRDMEHRQPCAMSDQTGRSGSDLLHG